MIILGIDTAIRCTGYGVVEFATAENLSVIDCGLIRNQVSASHSECLRRLAGGIRELAGKYEPDAAAIEGAFYGKNIKTAMILSYARGAVMTVLAEKNIPVYAYAPRKAKMAVCGRGGSSKEQVASIIASLLNLKTEKIHLDSTDALALAICHGQLAMRPGAEHMLPKKL